MLDTLTAADQLTAAGFDSMQAKALVAVLRDSESAAATKPELDAALQQLEARIDTRLEERLSVFVTKPELDSRLRQLEDRIEARIWRSALVQIISTVALVVALLRLL